MQKYYEDSLAWNKPAVRMVPKESQERRFITCRIYTDGLKIYTTIDSRMRNMPKKPVEEHLGGYLQGRFFAEKKNRKTVYQSAHRRTGETDTRQRPWNRQTVTALRTTVPRNQIRRHSTRPKRCPVFTWHGEKDTVMTDDGLHQVLQITSCAQGFVSMDPLATMWKPTWAVPTYTPISNMTWLTWWDARQIGSTIKPWNLPFARHGKRILSVWRARNVEQTIITGPVRRGRPTTARATALRRNGYADIRGLARSNNWISAYLMLSKLNPYGWWAGLIPRSGTVEQRHSAHTLAFVRAVRNFRGRDGEYLPHRFAKQEGIRVAPLTGD